MESFNEPLDIEVIKKVYDYNKEIYKYRDKDNDGKVDKEKYYYPIQLVIDLSSNPDKMKEEVENYFKSKYDENWYYLIKTDSRSDYTEVILNMMLHFNQIEYFKFLLNLFLDYMYVKHETQNIFGSTRIEFIICDILDRDDRTDLILYIIDYYLQKIIYENVHTNLIDFVNKYYGNPGWEELKHNRIVKHFYNMIKYILINGTLEDIKIVDQIFDKLNDKIKNYTSKQYIPLLEIIFDSYFYTWFLDDVENLFFDYKDIKTIKAYYRKVAPIERKELLFNQNLFLRKISEVPGRIDNLIDMIESDFYNNFDIGSCIKPLIYHKIVCKGYKERVFNPGAYNSEMKCFSYEEDVILLINEYDVDIVSYLIYYIILNKQNKLLKYLLEKEKIKVKPEYIILALINNSSLELFTTLVEYCKEKYDIKDIIELCKTNISNTKVNYCDNEKKLKYINNI